MAVTKDERFVYAQISFLHGFVEYDLVNDRTTRIAELPASRVVKRLSAGGDDRPELERDHGDLVSLTDGHAAFFPGRAFRRPVRLGANWHDDGSPGIPPHDCLITRLGSRHA
jgi:hypothetical protein